MSPVPTLKEIIEEHDFRRPYVRVIIGGAVLSRVTSVDYQFAFAQVPTCTITVPGREWLPSSVVEEASVQVWFGYRLGMSQLEQMVFGGAVVDSVSSDAEDVIIECVMDGPRKLAYGYNRRINQNFTAISAEDAVEDLLKLAGVRNYSINLDPWIIGTAVPQTIQFSTYGEAVNKVAEVDGSPWYTLPTGQVRVNNMDPIPNDTARRTYYSSILTGPVESQPLGIPNPDARPRIVGISRRRYRAEVANFITVDGAVLVTLGPNGERNSEQITSEVDGLSGRFPNGAYWIPTPPLFQDFTFQNELIDTNAKAFETAERYFDLKNRLHEKVPLSIPGEPDVFLGETIRVVDPSYSGVSSLYFVEGYRTSISADECVTELQLTGGPESGTKGHAAPFAEFFWKYQALHELTPGGFINLGNWDLGPIADLASKLCEDVPAEIGTPEQGADFQIGEDKRTVLIQLDASASADYDGFITEYRWQYVDYLSETRTLFGQRVLLVFNPDLTSSVQVTLRVTDNTGRTDEITKTIYTSAEYVDPGTLQPSEDWSLNDTEFGGGIDLGPCCIPGSPDELLACVESPLPEIPGELPEIPGSPEQFPPPENPTPSEQPGACNGIMTGFFIAAEEYAMASADNRTWNDLTKEAAGVAGDFISVASAVQAATGMSHGVFGTSAGEIVITSDLCLSGEIVAELGSSVNCLMFDMLSMGDPASGESYGAEGIAGAGGHTGAIPVYNQANPGTLTIQEAYQQALAAGFSESQARVAVAIMMAESGLNSAATNTAGNDPPSTDRGIAQINSYYHPEVSDDCAFNTACAIKAMYSISSGGSDFSPWAAYNAETYKPRLSDVNAALGGPAPFDGAGEPLQFAAWAGCEDGVVWGSKDSGRTWEKAGQVGSAVKLIVTDRRLAREGAPALAVFASKGIYLPVGSGAQMIFTPIQIGGSLKASLGMNSIVSAALNQTALLVLTSDGEAHFSLDPLGDPSGWYQGTSLSSATAAAGGWGGDFLVAGTGYSGSGNVAVTTNNDSFATVGSMSSKANALYWQGMEGKYLAASAGGLMTTIDKGATWGSLRPNAEFGTSWPAGAVGRAVSWALGPRACNIVDPTNCVSVSFLGYTWETPEVVFDAGNYEVVSQFEVEPDDFTTKRGLAAAVYVTGPGGWTGEALASGVNRNDTFQASAAGKLLILGVLAAGVPTNVSDDTGIEWKNLSHVPIEGSDYILSLWTGKAVSTVEAYLNIEPDLPLLTPESEPGTLGPQTIWMMVEVDGLPESFPTFPGNGSGTETIAVNFGDQAAYNHSWVGDATTVGGALGLAAGPCALEGIAPGLYAITGGGTLSYLGFGASEWVTVGTGGPGDPTKFGIVQRLTAAQVNGAWALFTLGGDDFEHLWRSTDGSTWEMVSEEDDWCYAVSWDGNGRLWLLTADKIKYSEDGGTTWNESYDRGGLAFSGDIYADGDSVYVAWDDPTTAQVSVGFNSGGGWAFTEILESLDAEPVNFGNSLQIVVSSGVAYLYAFLLVTTEDGQEYRETGFYSSDGATWASTAINTTLSYNALDYGEDVGTRGIVPFNAGGNPGAFAFRRSTIVHRMRNNEPGMQTPLSDPGGGLPIGTAWDPTTDIGYVLYDDGSFYSWEGSSITSATALPSLGGVGVTESRCLTVVPVG